MALINKIDNIAAVSYGGNEINSNNVSTLLLLAPTIIKAVDKILASIGEELTYTITITNLGLSAITDLPFSDVIASGITFEPSTFMVNGTTQTATVTGATISYLIPSIAALGTAVIVYKVIIVGGTV